MSDLFLLNSDSLSVLIEAAPAVFTVCMSVSAQSVHLFVPCSTDGWWINSWSVFTGGTGTDTGMQRAKNNRSLNLENKLSEEAQF